MCRIIIDYPLVWSCIRELIAHHAEEGALGEFLLEELYSFVGEGWEQEDDITLLSLQRSPLLS